MSIMGARDKRLPVIMSVVALLPALGSTSRARARMPAPVSTLAHAPDGEHRLADQEGPVKHFRTPANASGRIGLVPVGKTTPPIVHFGGGLHPGEAAHHRHHTLLACQPLSSRTIRS